MWVSSGVAILTLFKGGAIFYEIQLQVLRGIMEEKNPDTIKREKRTNPLEFKVWLNMLNC